MAPAAAYLGETGTLCGACFGRLQDEQSRAAVHDERLSASFTRRAWVLGSAHAMWGLAAIAAADLGRLPSWLSSILVVASLVLAYTLRLRWRSAFLTAITLDVAGEVAFLAWGAYAATHGSTWMIALLAIFPLSLVGLTWWLRNAYAEKADPDGLRRPGILSRWLAPAAAIISLVGIATHLALRPRRDPARQLVQEALPAWESARSRPGSEVGGPWARALVGAAHPWPGVARALEDLDRGWPDEGAVRTSVKEVNRAFADAGLPYVVDVWAVGDRPPILLTHTLVSRVPWRIGERAVEVRRLRRLDALNVELGLYGATEEGLPAVMLDRVEAGLARDLPAMFAEGASRPAELNDFDREVLARHRTWLQERLGAAVAAAGTAIEERNRLFEEMRSRLNGGQLQLDPPDGFVLGAEWLAKVEPLAELTRSGGPLVLQHDLDKVVSADEKLREAATARVLKDLVELLALSTEGHEARHAVDEGDNVAPPPPQLFEVMEGRSTAMIAMADKELRAYLGEIHDAPFPACLTLARLMRQTYGKHARPTPHAFATLAILDQLDPGGGDHEPAERLAAVCTPPDADVRRHAAEAWQKLYGAPMPAAQRLAAN